MRANLIRKYLARPYFVFLCLVLMLMVLPQPARVAAQAPPADFISYADDLLPARARDLYIMRVDGTDKRQVTQGMRVWFASWAPDGKKLAVTTERTELYTLNPDGSDLKLLATGVASPGFWSPD